MKIKKGDKVIVLSGRDRNKTGIVEKVMLKTNELIVGGVNIVKKHVKVSKKNPSGGVIEVSKPITVSRVQVVCPSCNKGTRVGYEVKGKEKIRVCKKCGKTVIQKNEKDKA